MYYVLFGVPGTKYHQLDYGRTTGGKGREGMKLWLIQILHKLVHAAFDAWKRAVKRKSRNEKAERKAHMVETPSSRYVEHPVGKTARAKRGKTRNRP